jgi:hypothetical protein
MRRDATAGAARAQPFDHRDGRVGGIADREKDFETGVLLVEE